MLPRSIWRIQYWQVERHQGADRSESGEKGVFSEIFRPPQIHFIETSTMDWMDVTNKDYRSARLETVSLST